MKYEAYDVAAKKKCTIKNPKAVKNARGIWMIQGQSSITGNKVCRIVGSKKPSL